MSKDQITLKQLMRIADGTPWERFEAMTDGRLLLKDCAQTMLSEEEDVNPLLWVFEMRVGLHFERPMQAIMSCGHFIRMRSTVQWMGCLLAKLDPENPSGCLYVTGTGYSWLPQIQRLQQAHLQNQAQLVQLPPGWTTNNMGTPYPYLSGAR